MGKHKPNLCALKNLRGEIRDEKKGNAGAELKNPRNSAANLPVRFRSKELTGSGNTQKRRRKRASERLV